MKNKLIKIDGKVFARTLAFGNQNAKVVFKNKRKYDRKKAKNETYV